MLTSIISAIIAIGSIAGAVMGIISLIRHSRAEKKMADLANQTIILNAAVTKSALAKTDQERKDAIVALNNASNS